MILKNKKGDFAVTLLVFMTVALVLGTSFIFATDLNKIEEKIADAGFLNKIYLDKEKIDFYIQESMEKAGGISQNKEDFIFNFKKEIKNYQSELVNFNEIFSQAENCEIEDKKAIMKFKFQMSYDEDIFSVVYNYDKQFEIELGKV